MISSANAALLLALLIEQAPRLRSAGISHVTIEGLSFDLRPADVEPAHVEQEPGEDDRSRSALHDPDTFGGRRVPGNLRRENT